MNIILSLLIIILGALVCWHVLKNKRYFKDVRFYIAMILLISTPIILIGLNS